MKLSGILAELEPLADEKNLAGMARFGIRPPKGFGVPMPVLRKMGRTLGRDHRLAGELWAAGYRETYILATLVDRPEEVGEDQMEAWVLDFYDWEVCDQCCQNLFAFTPFAYEKAVEWSGREEEFVKRAGFVLMAKLAQSDKQAPDEPFEAFLKLVARDASDERNFVKKAVNWALRQIGKRNRRLNMMAVELAEGMSASPDKTTRWVARDAWRELTSDKIRAALRG